MSQFSIRPEFSEKLVWSHGSCGNPGCSDPECCCALCRKPIGVSEDDRRWEDHDEFCGDCDLCRDQVPIILFAGEGEAMLQAAFHTRCFEQACEFHSSASVVVPS